MAQPYPISRETREEAIFFGDGGAVYGPFALKIFDVDDVEVWTKATDGTWTIATPTVAKVDPAQAFDEFTITFAVNIPLTTKIKVLSARTHERSAGVTSGTKLSADALEKELTKQGTILQELRRDISRSVQSEFGAAGYKLSDDLTDGQVLMKDGARLVPGPNAQDIALAQGYAETAAAVAAALPPIVDGSMMVDEGGERKTKTLAEVNEKLGVFDTQADASAATIDATIHRVRLGDGSIYTDTNEGSAPTFASNGGTRTWYRVADVGSFPSRSDFISALPLDQLRECTANGLRYARYATGYPEIDDAPGWFPLGEPEFEHYGGSAHSDLPPYAEIYHKYDYAAHVQLDVIKIKRAKLNTLRALTPPIDDPADGEVTREKLPTLASRHGAMAVTNFMAFRNADGTAGWDNDQLVPNGFLITDGQVVSSWVNGTNLDRTEGFTLQLDGTMKRRTRGVGDAADYVADGAWLGASWGAWIVEDGVNVSSAGSAYFDTGRSARTLIGTNAEGDILLFTFQGSSSSFGPLYSELFALVTAEGATDCYLLEGGGSSQIWWGSYYACPSSDTSYYEERTMPSALGIFCAIQEYDSGYKQIPLASGFTPNADVGVRFRQVGATVHFEANVTGTFSVTPALVTDSEVSSDTTVKNYLWQFGRYLPKDGNGVARGYVAGATGVGGTWNTGNGIFMRKLNSGDTTTYLAGSASWSARHAK